MSRARDTANQINRVNSSAADATAITVDSSENVGIGTATPSGKLELYGSGISDLPLVINHAWGSSSTALISASAASSEVFKVERNGDLTLSGGVYLGGTGSANKLDDFEEGTWTPSLGGNAVYDIQTGHYVKVGGLVYASFAIRPTSLGTGYAGAILGLPFPTSDFVGISVAYYDGAATSHLSILGGVTGSQISLYLKTSATNDAYNSTNFFQNNARIYGQATYRTTA